MTKNGKDAAPLQKMIIVSRELEILDGPLCAVFVGKDQLVVGFDDDRVGIVFTFDTGTEYALSLAPETANELAIRLLMYAKKATKSAVHAKLN